jgi:hypothetical protein
MLQPLYPTEKRPGTYYIRDWIYLRARVNALGRKSRVPARTQTSDLPTCRLHTMPAMLQTL